MIYSLFSSIGFLVLLIFGSRNPQNNLLVIHISIIN